MRKISQMCAPSDYKAALRASNEYMYVHSMFALLRTRHYGSLTFINVARITYCYLSGSLGWSPERSSRLRKSTTHGRRDLIQ